MCHFGVAGKPKWPARNLFFFLIRKEFRKSTKTHSNNICFAAGKVGGIKWRSMAEVEKAPFVYKKYILVTVEQQRG